jgi:aconitase A
VPDGGGEPITFEVSVCLDTPREREYVEHGGILPYVIRVRLG